MMGKARPTRVRSYAGATAAVAVATVLGRLLGEAIADSDVVMLYVGAVSLVAWAVGRWPGLFAATLSVLAYNFFFIEPLHSLAVSEQRNLITFAALFGIGLLIRTLTTSSRRNEAAAETRERHTQALYALSRELAAAGDERRVALALARGASQTLQCGARVRLGAEHGGVEVALGSTVGPPRTVRPIRGKLGPAGELHLWPGTGELPGPESELVDAFTMQTGLALERAQLSEAARAAAVRASAEETRSSLLSAVSHDLRTPLAAITGAATTLRDQAAALDAAAGRDLVETICDESERLERLVGNLLEVTRVEAAGLQLEREWVPAEELIGAALTRLERRLSGRRVDTQVGAELPLVRVDPVLCEQMLFNVLENAVKYSPPGSPITIRCQVREGSLLIEIADEGPGLAPGTEGRIFEKFYRGDAGRHAPGAGLGLAIVRAIATAHGGTVLAQNRPGRGAVFQIALPIGGVPPSVVPETATRTPEE